MEQTVKVTLDTREFDRGIKRMQGGFGNLTGTIGAAVAAFGGFQLAKGFLNTARSIENLKFQLSALTGSTAEAAKAMEILKDFAGGVPFQLQEIQRAAPSLLAVAKSTDELNELLAITGDIAAASGLNFQDVALQLQRTFSAGIGAADLFRDRGVKAMLGFQEGVQYSAKQSRDLIINAFRDGTTAIAGASADMATSFDGQISMISDKFDKFKESVMDAGPFEMLKAAVTLVNKQLEANFGDMEKAAEKIGEAIVQATFDVLLFGAKVIDGMKPAFDFVGKSIEHIVSYAEGLPTYIKTLGILGFLALGIKGKLIVVVIGGIVKEVVKIFNFMFDLVARGKGIMADAAEAIGMKGAAANFRKEANDIQKEIKALERRFKIMNRSLPNHEMEEGLAELGITFKGVDADIGKINGTMGKYEIQVRKVISALIEQRNAQRAADQAKLEADKQKAPMQKLLQADPKEVKAAQKAADALKAKFINLQESLFSEEEAEQASFNKQLATLDEYYKGKELLDVNYHRIKEQLETRHQKKLADISKREVNAQVDIFKSGQFQNLELAKLTEDQKVQFAMDAGRSVLGELGKQNKAAFQAAKALNIAMAIMNTAAGATKALSQGGVFGPLLAGLVIAAGAVQIAAISSQTYQGRKTGGLVQKGQPYQVGEAGVEAFVPNQTGTIIPNRNMGGGGGPVNVNFNINTVDAQGMDELLTSRRGTITNIIREATQQNGQRSMV